MAGSVCARENRVVVRIRVARRTDAAGISMIDAPPGVTKRRARPRRGVVTSRTGCGEDRWCGFVDGVCRIVVIRGVAAVTRRWQRRVIAVHMAARASHSRVGAGQREGRRAVFKICVGPQLTFVAPIARCGVF